MIDRTEPQGRYAFLLELFENPSEKNLAKLADAVSEDGFREEFLNEVEPHLAERIAPDLCGCTGR